MPYYRVQSAPYAEELIGTIVEQIMTNNKKTQKLKSDHEKGVFANLGKRSSDEQNFQNIIDKEGVINLRVGSFDEL